MQMGEKLINLPVSRKFADLVRGLATVPMLYLHEACNQSSSKHIELLLRARLTGGVSRSKIH